VSLQWIWREEIEPCLGQVTKNDPGPTEPPSDAISPPQEPETDETTETEVANPDVDAGKIHTPRNFTGAGILQSTGARHTSDARLGVFPPGWPRGAGPPERRACRSARACRGARAARRGHADEGLAAPHDGATALETAAAQELLAFGAVAGKHRGTARRHLGARPRTRPTSIANDTSWRVALRTEGSGRLFAMWTTAPLRRGFFMG